MKKMIVAAVAAASLSGAALAVAALAPIGIASAQNSGQQQTAPDSTAKAAPKTKPQRRAAVRARIKQRATRRGEIAEYLGVTPEALAQELQSGKSLAEIAGPKTQGLIEMLTTNANARIDAALAAGKIDATRAAALKGKVGPVIERLVNAKRT